LIQTYRYPRDVFAILMIAKYTLRIITSFKFSDIVQWPTTLPGAIKPHSLADGLGLCFSVLFWHLSQQDVRLKNSQGTNLLILRMTVRRYPGTIWFFLEF
jgi:hypothetical protein